MNKLKFILYILYIQNVYSFYNINYITYNKCSSTTSLRMTNNNNTFHNKSKIYKIDFSKKYIDEEDDFMNTPKYAFNMTEFDMTILRIYVYIITTIYFLNLL